MNDVAAARTRAVWIGIVAVAMLILAIGLAPRERVLRVAIPTMPGARLEDPATLRLSALVDPPMTAAIRGTVSTRGAGPLHQARVCAFARAGELSSVLLREPYCAQSDRDGRWAIENLPPARYEITAHAAEHIPTRWRGPDGSDRIDVRAATTRDGIALVLDRGGVLVRGIVRDATGGVVEAATVTAMPSRGATTNIHRAPGWTVRGDAEGRFAVWVAPGDVALWVEADGYAPGRRRAPAPSDGIEVQLFPEAVIEGTVVDATTREAVAGAFVHAFGTTTTASAYADDAGRFRIDRLPPARYSLTASIDDAHGRARQPIALDVGEHATTRIELRPATLVSVRIARPDGEPCESGSVKLVDAGSRWTRHPGGELEVDGTITLRGVAHGDYVVAIECEGWLAPAEAPRIRVGPQRSQEHAWTVAEGASIQGVVVDDEGLPVPDAEVSATPPGRRPAHDTSDATGAFSIRGLASVRHVVTARRDDGGARTVKAASPPVDVDPRENADDIRLVLPRPGSIVGSVRDESGKAIVEAAITAVPLDPGRSFLAAMSNHEGRFHVSDAAPGRYTIRVDGMADPAPEVELAPGSEVEVQLVAAPRNGAITGRLVDGDGQPVPDVAILLRRSRSGMLDDDLLSDLTDTEGRFALDGLVDTPYDVVAQRHRDVVAEASDVRPGADVELTVAALGRIAGTVRIGDLSPARYDVRLNGPTRFVFATFDEQGGGFRFDELPVGSYRVVVECAEGSGEQAIELGAGEAREDIIVEIEPELGVRGRVLDPDTDTPVEGVTVTNTSRDGAQLHFSGDHVLGRSTTGVDGIFEARVSAGARQLSLRLTATLATRFHDPMTVALESTTGERVDLGDVYLVPVRLRLTEPAGRIGITWDVDTLAADADRGVRIASVVAGSPAAQAGLVEDEVITAVDRWDLRGRPHLFRLVTHVPVGTTLRLRLEDGREVDVTTVPASG